MLTDYLHLVESLQQFLASSPKDKLTIHIEIVAQKLGQHKPTAEYLSKIDKPHVQQWFAELDVFLNQHKHQQNELEICLTKGADVMRKYLSYRL